MNKIKIGKSLFGEPKAHPEGPIFKIYDDSMALMVFLDAPTVEETETFKRGEVQVGFTEEEDVIFLLFKLGDFHWLDAPYNAQLEVRPPKLSRPKDGQGYGVLLILADARDGVVRHMRLITLSSALSHHLAEAIERQNPVVDYDTKLEALYRKYPTPESLLSCAKF